MVRQRRRAGLNAARHPFGYPSGTIEGMRAARLLPAGASILAGVGCSLVTSVDGLSGGPPDAGSDVAVEGAAGSDTGTPDAGTPDAGTRDAGGADAADASGSK